MKKMIIQLMVMMAIIGTAFLANTACADSNKVKKELTFKELSEIVMKLTETQEFDSLKYYLRLDFTEVKLSLYF
ncbi:MAG: hypothetical protein ABIE74_00040 [Pseudomonadota bacterium]